MDNIKRCNRCILPESVPGISFDNEGICNYCREYERNFSIWNQIAEKKEKEFGELLERARKLKRTYDCLIPLSGGKDSTYALYLCSKFYGLRTLAVTFDNGFLTEPAKKILKMHFPTAMRIIFIIHLIVPEHRNFSGSSF